MKKLFRFLGCILLTMVIGGISGIATIDGVKGWYMTLNKPSFNPPNYLFGPVWTTLYFLMGVSLYLVLSKPATTERKKAVTIFGVQLALNFFWSVIFFNLHEPGWALADIILMWLAIVAMIVTFYRIDKTAGLMQLPYIAWVSFATLLNGAIVYLN